MSKPYVFSGLILLLLSSSALARPISCQIGGSQINIDSTLVANISVPARLEIERQIKPLLLITDHEKNHDFVGQNQTLKPNTMRRHTYSRWKKRIKVCFKGDEGEKVDKGDK